MKRLLLVLIVAMMVIPGAIATGWYDDFTTNTSLSYTNNNSRFTWVTATGTLNKTTTTGSLLFVNGSTPIGAGNYSREIQWNNKEVSDGLVFGAVENSGLYNAGTRYEVFILNSTSYPVQLYIRKRVSGTQTNLISPLKFSSPDLSGSSHILTAIWDPANTTTIIVYFDGVQIASTTNTSITDAGYYGLYDSQNSAKSATKWVSSTWVSFAYEEEATPDTTPPLSISALGNTTATTCNSIVWTWTDPADADFNEVVVYRNNTWLHNVTHGTQTDTWAGLPPSTAMTISTHTADTVGNINATWVNATLTTPECEEPEALGYYAFGDSITRATGGGSLNADGTDVYIMQMQETHDAGNTSDHNIDGGGKTSLWGAGNFHNYPGDPWPITAFAMFGANDRSGGYSGTWTAQNMKKIYDGYEANGTHAYVLIPPLTNPAEGGTPYADQYDNITIMQNYYDANDIRYIKAYDAIDTTPWNGEPGQWNTSLMYDYVHVNKEGHRLIGEYVWEYLNPAAPDTTPPGPITDLTGIPSCNSIQWTWTPPGDADFAGVSIYNQTGTGAWTRNVTANSDEWTSLAELTNYGIGTHTYDAVGNMDPDWVNASSKTSACGTAPVAAFTANNVSTCTGVPVVFTDQSTNSPTGWAWSFGEGNTSSSQNPSHTYGVTGSMTVALEATNAYGSDTETKTGYITVTSCGSAPAAPATCILGTNGNCMQLWKRIA